MSAPEIGTTVEARIGLELALHPDDAAGFWRVAALKPLGAGRRPRPRPFARIWHDGADGALARQGLALMEERRGRRATWRLERLEPGWPAVLRLPPLAEAATPALLGQELPPTLAPVARFDGEVRAALLDGAAGVASVAVRAGTLQGGTLHALAATVAACRVVMEGAPRETFALARALAGPLRLAVPEAPLPAEGGAARPPAAALTPGATLDDALAALIAQLAQALLHWAPRVGAHDPEPVHQMRVALRRLRAALKLFRRAAACPELDAVAGPLRDLARRLGAARDWDVFIDGLGATVAARLPSERAVLRLLREARARRARAYADLSALVAGPALRQLGLMLAELVATRPWQAEAAEGGVARDAEALRAFLAQGLRKRLRKARALSVDFDALPDAALHALRLQCKRLRYSAEFAAPLFPGRAARRYLRRLAAVQERLGRLNDGVVAAQLVGELGGGRGRALAAGVVLGYVAARGGRAREKAARAWRRFAATEPFWG